MMLQALAYGLIWSVMCSVYVFLILKFYPFSMLHDYPKDIQELPSSFQANRFSMLHDYPKDIQAAANIEKPTKAKEKALNDSAQPEPYHFGCTPCCQ